MGVDRVDVDAGVKVGERTKEMSSSEGSETG